MCDLSDDLCARCGSHSPRCLDFNTLFPRAERNRYRGLFLQVDYSNEPPLFTINFKWQELAPAMADDGASEVKIARRWNRKIGHGGI